LNDIDDKAGDTGTMALMIIILIIVWLISHMYSQERGAGPKERKGRRFFLMGPKHR
jgi:hypothetical protein